MTKHHNDALESATAIRHAVTFVAPLTRDAATHALHDVGGEMRNVAHQMTLAVDVNEWPILARRICALANALDGSATSATATKEGTT